MAGRGRQETQIRRNAPYWFYSHDFFILLCIAPYFYYQPRGGTAHTELYSPISIINQENVPQGPSNLVGIFFLG